MIHYQLRCAGAHEFEGWFRDSAAFDDQAKLGLLCCPYCGTTQVERALMAPAVRDSRRRRIEEPSPAAVPETAPVPSSVPAGNPVPDVVMAVLQKIRQEVESRCENVGDRFADEALQMHRGDMEKRGIYGTMSEAERELLEDEGVAVQHVPWVARAES